MSRRYRRRKSVTRRQRTSRQKTVLVLLVCLLVPVFAGTAAAGGKVWMMWEQAPPLSALEPRSNGETSIIFADDGSRLGYIRSDVLRTPVGLDRMAPVLLQATVAIEDRRFYEHDGVDWESVARAVIKDISLRQKSQGASTLTMQLVRNLYASDEKSYERKITEARLARQLEKTRSKRWILEQYLNNVPYGAPDGQEIYGAHAAARTYFDKPASELTLPEAALLAGLPQAPTEYTPTLNPQAAKNRRADVLNAMVRSRHITPEVAEEAKRAKLGLRENRFYQSRREAYFFDYVRQELVDRYGEELVERGGLRVYTTLKPSMQREARRSIRAELDLERDPAATVVSIDPSNGYIKAMASSTDYSKSKFNLAAQGRRQPGSTFKTMVLLAALNKDADPKRTYYKSRPLDLQLPKWGKFKVKTYDGSYGGLMNLKQALLSSDNSVFAQLTLDVKPVAVRKMAREMGVTSTMQANPSIGLGGLRRGVSPLDMASSYATIANKGLHVRPVAVRKVTFPDGEVEITRRGKRERAFSKGVALTATDILAANVKRGTGKRAQMGCAAAGKTGTTDSYKDAWFVGYTPRLSTAVWVGYPDEGKAMRDVHGIKVAGGTFPASIWGRYMEKVVNKCRTFFGKRARGLKPFCRKYSECLPGGRPKPRPYAPQPYAPQPYAPAPQPYYAPPQPYTPQPYTPPPAPQEPAPAPAPTPTPEPAE